MVKVVMFDLGDTLIDGSRRPFPHVEEALARIAEFVTEDGTPLQTCLLSDFMKPKPPSTPEKISALFNQYLIILDQTGLRPFFEPVYRRVTISTHVNASKPSSVIFKEALRRLGAPSVHFKDCLLITENQDHVYKVRALPLKMKALHFGTDFTDWAEAPALIAKLVSPDGEQRGVAPKEDPTAGNGRGSDEALA
jgi:FMN phosphatase YigB (HAD superfamily)